MNEMQCNRPEPSRQRRSRRRLRLAAAVGALVAGSIAAATGPAHASAPDAASVAGACKPAFSIVLSGAPNLDMALGFANGSTNNAPLSMRDSSGLSRAELWVEEPGPFGYVVLRNVNTDTGVFAAARSSSSNASPVVAKTFNTQNSSQWWRKDQIGGFVKYTSPDGKRLTGVPGAQSPTNGKPWQLHPAGVGGDQFFGQKFNGGCG